MRYTDAWATLVPVVKDTIGSSYADVKVGAGLNFNALDAVEGATNSASTGLFGALLGGVTGQTNPSAPPIQAANVNNLLSNGLDFLGISAYAPYTGANFGITEFQVRGVCLPGMPVACAAYACSMCCMCSAVAMHGVGCLLAAACELCCMC